MKRVPLDFAHPLRTKWPGYLNPYFDKCPQHGKTCFDGYTGGRRWFETIVRLLMLAGEEGAGVASADDCARRSADEARRGRTYPHPYMRELPTRPTFSLTPKYVYPYRTVPVTADLTALTTALAGRAPDELVGYGGSESWVAQQRIVAAAGLDPETWGICPVCKGEGYDPAQDEAREAWTRTDPPAGDGYQLWDTTSEGSPVSPVFATLDELCAWCETGATTFGTTCRATAAEWKKMLDDGLVVHREGNTVFL